MALSPDETRLLLADFNHARVVVVDATDGRWVRTLQGPAGTLVNPCAVAMVPRTGQVLVVDWKRHLVVVFAGMDDDTVVRTLGDGGGHGPRQLFMPHCGIAVLDEGDAADRSEGAAPGQFNGPTAVSVVSSALTGSGETWLVVGDSNNRRVQVLTVLGAVVRVLVAGDGVGPLCSWLGGVTVCAATCEVLVLDSDNHRVVSWRLGDGGGCRVVCGTGERGAGDGQLACPVGLVTTSSGALWVVGGNHRLCVFR